LQTENLTIADLQAMREDLKYKDAAATVGGSTTERNTLSSGTNMAAMLQSSICCIHMTTNFELVHVSIGHRLYLVPEVCNTVIN